MTIRGAARRRVGAVLTFAALCVVPAACASTRSATDTAASSPSPQQTTSTGAPQDSTTSAVGAPSPSPSGSPSQPHVVEITITPAGCPGDLSTPAGLTTIEVRNHGAADVNEFELKVGTRVIGEVEHLPAGADGSFTLRLDDGMYTLWCPGGDGQSETTLTVGTGIAVTPEASPFPDKVVAVDKYVVYLVGQADVLQNLTRVFTDAVRAGDVAAAKTAYVAARQPYEAIEPAVESFGDLAPKLDAREGQTTLWTGFHPIAKALWEDGSITADTIRLADQLDADVADLARQIAQIELQPAQIANAAAYLLLEMSTTMTSGGAEPYSHTDVDDVAANLAGARQAFAILQTIVATADPALAAQINDGFADLDSLMSALVTVGGDRVLFTNVPESQRQVIAAAVVVVGAPMSKVAAIVA